MEYIIFGVVLLLMYMSVRGGFKKQKETSTLTSVENKPIIKTENFSISRDYDYNNHFKNYYGSYDYITPAAAKKRADNMAYSSRFDNDKYHDLKNRGFSPKNNERLKDIENLEGEDLRSYFIEIFENQDDYVTSVVMKAIYEKLSKHDELLLLNVLENIPKNRITSWIITKKSESFFFSEKVYETAWIKKNS